MTENISEKVISVNSGKTSGLLSVNCMTKDFKVCKIDLDVYDPLGQLVFSERDVETVTYTIKFFSPGEYKVSFYNKEVAISNQRNQKSICLWDTSATGAERQSKA